MGYPDGGCGGRCGESEVVFGPGVGVDEGSVGERDGVYGVWVWVWGAAGLVGVVEEEGAAVGEPDVLFCQGLARVGGEGEDLVVVRCVGGALGHFSQAGRSTGMWDWIQCKIFVLSASLLARPAVVSDDRW